MKWLLEQDVFHENIDALIEALKEQNIGYKVIEYIPFEGCKTFASLLPEKECVVVYGSLQLARQLQREAKWVPTAFCDLPKFECFYYYPKYGKYLLNDPYIMLPYGDLLRQKDFLFDTLGDSDCLFVRPSTGFKSFTGRVVSKEQWNKEIELLNHYGVDPESIAIVAGPKNIQSEWRLFIYNQKVITASLYKHQDKNVHQLGCPDNVVALAEEIASVWQPERIFCLDICDLPDGSLKLIEINAASCAGLYACDKKLFVKAMTEASIEEWKEYFE